MTVLYDCPSHTHTHSPHMRLQVINWLCVLPVGLCVCVHGVSVCVCVCVWECVCVGTCVCALVGVWVCVCLCVRSTDGSSQIIKTLFKLSQWIDTLSFHPLLLLASLLSPSLFTPLFCLSFPHFLPSPLLFSIYPSIYPSIYLCPVFETFIWVSGCQ